MTTENDPIGRVKEKRKEAKEAYGSYGAAPVGAMYTLQSLRRRRGVERSRSFKKMMPKHCPDRRNDRDSILRKLKTLPKGSSKKIHCETL